MEIALHIGLEKTGTSTIQKYLQRNRDDLLRQGILFPTAPGEANQTLLAAACMANDRNIRERALRLLGPDFAADMMRNLKAEVATAQPERLLLSNEHCSSRLRTTAEVEKLRDLMSELGTVTQVVVYLRRQDEFLLSRYSTAVKTGKTRSFDMNAATKATDSNFRKLLKLWGGVFGQAALRPRLFQQSAWVDGDLIADFCDAVGATLGDTKIRPRNLSLSAEGLELLRRLNETSGGKRDGRLVSAIATHVKGSKLSLSTAQRRELLQHYAASNAWVAQTWFGREALFEDVPDGLPETPLPELTTERFQALSAAVAAP